MKENDKSMEEYKTFKELLNNQKEDYKFIDKLGYDDWNKKETLRNYIKQIRNENKEKQDKLEYVIEQMNFILEDCEKIDNDIYLVKDLKWEINQILQIIKGEDK